MAKKFLLKECECCGKSYSPEGYFKTSSKFFPTGYLTICKNCIEDMVADADGNLDTINSICRWADYPFLVSDWVKLYSVNKEKTFTIYVNIIYDAVFNTGVNWSSINDKWKALDSRGELESEIELLSAENKINAQKRWGFNYDDEQLFYLEELYNGLLKTQNIVGDLQVDQAKKLCKISLIIDEKIRGGEDFKDLLAGYDKIVKVGDFTPKNVKNANDFDSAGEIFAFLEKRGWINKFYDGAIKDTVDNTMKNIQLWTRNLYTNETGIAEDIERRIEGLKIANSMVEDYDREMTESQDLDNFESDGYDIDEGEFNPEAF